MRFSKEKFIIEANKLLRKEFSFWLKEDYRAIEKMLITKIISPDFAEAELDRLTEELIGEIHKESKENE